MIELRQLSKQYGSTAAVAGVDAVIEPGQVTGLLGPNGSGKSTIMRMIMGLDAPTHGRALIAGREYRSLDWPLREVGALIDGRSYHPGRSAGAHLMGLARANRIEPDRVVAVLDMVGLRSVAKRRAGRFSLGMGQRLGIAAALLGDPGILLLDEPTNGLDPDGIRWVRDLVKRLAADGRTVLVSSHLITEMALAADRALVIGKGQILGDLDLDRLPVGASLEDVYLDLSHDSVEYRAEGAYPTPSSTSVRSRS